MYSGKYKASVWRFQVVSDLLGRIVALYGPVLGTAFDGHTFGLSEEHGTARVPGEVFLGDCHYSDEADMLTRRSSEVLDLDEPDIYYALAVVQYFRSRIEHVIGRVMGSHQAFDCHFRSGEALLCALVKIAAHVENITLRSRVAYPITNDPRVHDFGDDLRVSVPDAPAPTWIWRDRNEMGQN